MCFEKWNIKNKKVCSKLLSIFQISFSDCALPSRDSTIYSEATGPMPRMLETISVSGSQCESLEHVLISKVERRPYALELDSSRKQGLMRGKSKGLNRVFPFSIYLICGWPCPWSYFHDSRGSHWALVREGRYGLSRDRRIIQPYTFHSWLNLMRCESICFVLRWFSQYIYI